MHTSRIGLSVLYRNDIHWNGFKKNLVDSILQEPIYPVIVPQIWDYGRSSNMIFSIKKVYLSTQLSQNNCPVVSRNDKINQIEYTR